MTFTKHLSIANYVFSFYVPPTVQCCTWSTRSCSGAAWTLYTNTGAMLCNRYASVCMSDRQCVVCLLHTLLVLKAQFLGVATCSFSPLALFPSPLPTPPSPEVFMTCFEGSNLYMYVCMSILMFACCVWHFSLQ